MTVKELKCVYSSLWHCREIIETLASGGKLDFKDDDLEGIFYDINRMCITLTRKIDKLEGE